LISKWNTFIFIAVLVALGLFLFALPADPEASRFENRNMAAPPRFTAGDFLSGRFSDDLEAFLLDSIAFRTSFLAFSTALEDAYGIQLGGAIMVAIDHGDLGMGLVALPEPEPEVGRGTVPRPTPRFTPEPEPEVERGTVPRFTEPEVGQGTVPRPTEPEPEVGQGTVPRPTRVNPAEPFGVDMHKHPDAVMYGSFYVEHNSLAHFLTIVNEYRESTPDTVRIFTLLAPSQVEFLDERYRAGIARQDQAIQTIYSRLDPGIITVDAYSRIAARVESEYLYFRTDHHWTALGAYYAYRAFADAAGFAPITIDNYVEHTITDFLGSYARGTQNRVILDHPDTLYYYRLDTGVTFSRSLFVIPEDPQSRDYRIFLGGDHPHLDYTSSNKNGRTLIVIKDSYANAFIPWVSPHYERIIVLDPRSYWGSVESHLEEAEDADILFLLSALTPSLPGFVQNIENIR